MKNNNLNFIFLIIVQLSIVSCDAQRSKRWTKTAFNETIKTDVKLGLHIVPVTINGSTYQFLFDTGAPTAISKPLQKKLQYKVIDRGDMYDSDKNRLKVSYVLVDSLDIGDVTFSNVKAFVADFTDNPILECLNLDGIIGSNMMQISNWKIDYQNETISLSNEPFLVDDPSDFVVDFRSDDQYDIIVNLKMGRAKVSNMKIDYGNNSSISVPKNVFKVLADENILKESFVEQGYSQGGIVGKPISMTRYYGYLDSLQIGNLLSEDLLIRTGKSGLIGHDFLSRYIVAINWNEKKMRFKPHESWEDTRRTFGYSIGANADGEPTIFGVVEQSEAARNKLKTGMRILKIDSINFATDGDYCDFVDFQELGKDQIYMELRDENGNILKTRLSKKLLQKN
jgi:hypothetical protein